MFTTNFVKDGMSEAFFGCPSEVRVNLEEVFQDLSEPVINFVILKQILKGVQIWTLVDERWGLDVTVLEILEIDFGLI